MNELVEQLKSRVGLDNDKAQQAVQTVLDFRRPIPECPTRECACIP
jgi:hypothetical protein